MTGPTALTRSGKSPALGRATEDFPHSHLRRRILLPLAGILLGIHALSSVLLLKESRTGLERDAHRLALELGAQLRKQEHSTTLAMKSLLDQIALRDDVREVFLARDSARAQRVLQDAYSAAGSDLGITHLYIHDPDRQNFLRMHDPDRSGGTIGRWTLEKAIETGRWSAGSEPGFLGSFTLRCVVPWVVDGETIGYLEIGKEYDRILAELDEAVVLVVPKSLLDQTEYNATARRLGLAESWDRFANVVVPYSSAELLPRVVRERLSTADERSVVGIDPGLEPSLGDANGDPFLPPVRSEVVREGGRVLQVASVPLSDAQGRVAASLFLQRDITEWAWGALGSVALASAGLLLLVVAVLVAAFVLLGGIARTLDERSRKLHWSESQLREAQRVAHMGSYSYQIADDRIELSDAACDLLEIERTEAARGYDVFRRAIHPDDFAATEQIFINSVQERIPYSAFYRFLMEDGRIKHIHTQGETVYDEDGTPLRTIGTMQDVTDREEARRAIIAAREQAEAANRAKSEFLANMSHEIRTPLTTIIGYADLLRDQEDVDQAPGERTTILRTIRAAGDHLINIIDDILDLSRIEAGRLSLEPVEVDLRNLLGEVGSLFGPRASEKGLEFELRFEGEIPNRVLVDPIRLRQVLINLTGNSVKFTESGSIRVTVSAVSVPESRTARLRFEVEDSGTGMTPEQAKTVFDPFVQGDTSVTRRFGGTGLGLSISRRLTEALGGELALIRTAPGKGSCFRVLLPAPLPADTTWVAVPGSPADRPEETAPGLTLQARILVAEDAPVVQRLIRYQLERQGASVDVAENGKVALEMLEEAAGEGWSYDLLVTDMQMPEMDGYELVRTLRARGSTLPIVALTAHAMAEDRGKCLDAGCDDYATKPMDRAKLLQACLRSIELRAADVPEAPSRDGDQLAWSRRRTG